MEGELYMKKLILATAAIALLCIGVAAQAGVTGNPLLDGWASGGNSLSNGVYVRNPANYGFDTFSALLTVTPGSTLAVDDGANSWLAGDTVLGVGGKYASITPGEAGWSAFTGGAVNSLWSGTQLIKIQGKFGTAASDFSASTVAPGAGNGAGSLGTNGKLGAVQIRSSAYFDAATWSAGSGTLMLLDKASHIERSGAAAPDTDVSRLIWNWDAGNARLGSWEILLNASLLDRLYPTLSGSSPAAGVNAILTVQNGDGAYTDALVTIPAAVPEPSSFIALGALVAPLLALKRRRA